VGPITRIDPFDMPRFVELLNLAAKRVEKPWEAGVAKREKDDEAETRFPVKIGRKTAWFVKERLPTD